MKIAILGAGRIGSALFTLLNEQLEPRHEVAIYDQYNKLDHVVPLTLDVTDLSALLRVVKTHDIFISALPFQLNLEVAMAVCNAGKIYIDFTEDVQTGKLAIDYNIRVNHGGTVIPHCGLAPGYVSMLAAAMIQRFDTILNVDIKVGALALFDDNPSHYYRTWSTDGVINEYIKPAQIIYKGTLFDVPSLDGYENVQYFHQGSFEAFYTSGGIGTLLDTLLKHPKFDKERGCASYKTLRYKGHRDWVLNNLLPWQSEAYSSKQIERAVRKLNEIPTTQDDKVIIAINVTGYQNGHLSSTPFLEVFKATKGMTAIEYATANPVVGIVKLLIGMKEEGEYIPPFLLCENLAELQA